MKAKHIFWVTAATVILNVGVFMLLLNLKDSALQATLLLWWPVVSLAMFLTIAVLNTRNTPKVYFLDKDLAKYMEEGSQPKCTLTHKEIRFLTERQMLSEYTLEEFAEEFNNNRQDGYIYIEK